MDALGVVAEQERGEAQWVAAADLAVVGHVRLQTERRDRVALAMLRVEAHPAEELVGGEVEDDEVVTHVHVAVVVDPLGAHDVAVDVERGGELGHGSRGPTAQEIFSRLRAIHA